MDSRYEFGFTLVELLVTLAVSAILLSTAIPGSFALINNAQLATQANSFLGAYNMARSEAIKRGHPIHLCSRNGLECADTDQWRHGWIIFRDLNNNGRSEEKEILNIGEALARGYELTPNMTVRQLIFHGDGYVRKLNGSLPMTTFRLCAPNADEYNLGTHSREMVINGSGRVRLQYGREEITEC